MKPGLVEDEVRLVNIGSSNAGCEEEDNLIDRPEWIKRLRWQGLPPVSVASASERDFCLHSLYAGGETSSVLWLQPHQHRHPGQWQCIGTYRRLYLAGWCCSVLPIAGMARV